MVKRKPTSYEINFGEGDSFLLEFEKFVSKQKVSFFNEKLDIGMFFQCLLSFESVNYLEYVSMF